MRGILVAAVWLVAGTLGCGPPETELAKRFEAERARWQADRLEAHWNETSSILGYDERGRLAALHTAIARDFGGAHPPSPAELSNADTLLRLQIAGASALFCADLSATAPTLYAASGYARVDSLYGFDQGIHWNARLREAWIHEKRGDGARALALYTDLLELDDPSVSPENPLSRPLAVHAGFVAAEVLGPAEATRFRRRIRDRLEADPVEPRALAELCFLEADWESGLAILATLADSASRADERAEIALVMGEVLELGARDLTRAESRYREATLAGVTVPAGPRAMYRLSGLLAATGRAQEGLGIVNDLLGLEVLDSAGEALHAKARCLRALDRREEAREALALASRDPSPSPHGLAAAADLERNVRALGGPGAESAARVLVEAAERVPTLSLPTFRPWSWSSRRRTAVEDSLWSVGVRSLRELAERDAGPRGEMARAQASRLASERLRAAAGS